MPLASTLNKMIDEICPRFSSHPALSIAMQEPLSYGELHDKIVQTSGLLQDLSIDKGDPVAILAENSPEWVITYFAIVRLGAIVVPILPDFLAQDIHHILRETKTRLLFVSSRQLPKLEEFNGKKLRKIITFDDNKNVTAPPSESLPDLLAKRPRFSLQTLDKTNQKAEKVLPQDTAAIIFTSGTSGHSKAVMLSHNNLVANALSTSNLATITADWTFLSLLPLAHAYAFTVNCLIPLLHGSRIVFTDKPPTPTMLERICREEKPTAICLVPLIIEKIYKKQILPRLEKAPLLKVALNFPGLKKMILTRLGKRLLRFLGGEIQLIAIGGAALNHETEKFLFAAGVPYAVGYGLTEAAPVLSGGPVNDPTIAVGSAGKPLPGVAIKIVCNSPDEQIGEIHARGENIMKGYFQNPDATRETIDPDGWLATGDLGYLDQHNNLFITGRTKNVIVLPSGKNIYPEHIEDKLNSIAHVAESLLIANNDRLEAWVYPDYDLIDEETEDMSPALKRQHIDNLMKEIQRTVNDQLPSFAKIAAVNERREPFNKTATHKIKRYLYQSDPRKLDN